MALFYAWYFRLATSVAIHLFSWTQNLDRREPHALRPISRTSGPHYSSHVLYAHTSMTYAKVSKLKITKQMLIILPFISFFLSYLQTSYSNGDVGWTSCLPGIGPDQMDFPGCDYGWWPVPYDTPHWGSWRHGSYGLESSALLIFHLAYLFVFRFRDEIGSSARVGRQTLLLHRWGKPIIDHSRRQILSFRS